MKRLFVFRMFQLLIIFAGAIGGAIRTFLQIMLVLPYFILLFASGWALTKIAPLTLAMTQK